MATCLRRSEAAAALRRQAAPQESGRMLQQRVPLRATTRLACPPNVATHDACGAALPCTFASAGDPRRAPGWPDAAVNRLYTSCSTVSCTAKRDACETQAGPTPCCASHAAGSRGSAPTRYPLSSHASWSPIQRDETRMRRCRFPPGAAPALPRNRMAAHQPTTNPSRQGEANVISDSCSPFPRAPL